MTTEMNKDDFLKQFLKDVTSLWLKWGITIILPPPFCGTAILAAETLYARFKGKVSVNDLSALDEIKEHPYLLKVAVLDEDVMPYLVSHPYEFQKLLNLPEVENYLKQDAETQQHIEDYMCLVGV